MDNEKEIRAINPIIRLWRWWLTPRSTDPAVTYRERALRVILPLFIFLRFIATIVRTFVKSNLPESYSPEWVIVVFYMIPLLLSIYFLVKQKVDWAGALFLLHWLLVDLLGIVSEGYWYAGFQISMVMQVILAALLLPGRGMLPFLVVQLVIFGAWGHWLDINYYDPPFLSSGEPVARFWKTILILGIQETIILFIILYLRLEMEKSLRLQQRSISRLEAEANERQNIETQLRTSEHLFKSAFHASQLPFCITELETGHHIDANDAYLHLLQYTREEVIGHTAIELNQWSSNEERTRLVNELVATGKVRNWVDTITTKTGEKRNVVMSYDLLNIDGKSRILSLFEDVTERKLAEETREKLISELKQKNAELERFTYTVSHELKTPLVTIKNYTEIVAKDLQNENYGRVQKDFSRILIATDKMNETIQDLLELSRVGRLVNSPKEIDTHRLIHDVIEGLELQSYAENIKVEIAPDLPRLYGDDVRLREVFENLIVNAAKYMGDQADPLIEIGMRLQGDEQVIYVKDNGMGIDPQYHTRIFNLFEKLNPAIEGTGVGLTLVKSIVEYHGGKIWVETEGLGKGAAFCFTLPDGRTKSEIDTVV